MDRSFRLPLEHDTQQNKKENGSPLVVTYSPANIIKQISKTIEKHLSQLSSNEEIFNESALFCEVYTSLATNKNQSTTLLIRKLTTSVAKK